MQKMKKNEHYIFRKRDNDNIAIEFCENNFIYECSYENIKDFLLLCVTPKDLYDEQKKKELLDKFTNFSYEELSKEVDNLFSDEEQKNFIKSMSLNRNILKIESYDIDSLELKTAIITIDEDLLNDEKAKRFIELIKGTYQNNKESLNKQFCDMKKENENIEIAKKGLATYLENKKIILTKEEAIIADAVINRDLQECLEYIDRKYRQNHSIKFTMHMIMPVVLDFVILGSVLLPLHSLMAVLAFLASLGAVTFVSNQKWKKVIFNKYTSFKREIEEKYNFTYNKDDKKVSLYNPYQFYDAYTKCIKNTLELAYSELSTDLDEEIASLYALLNEYQEKDKATKEKEYFVTSLINIRKQIILKRSSKDVSLNKRVSQNDDEFIKGCIKYLMGKNITMLDDERVNTILERIKQNEEKHDLESNFSLMMEIVEYICEELSASSLLANDEVDNQSFQDKEDYRPEYDTDIFLKRNFKGSECNE